MEEQKSGKTRREIRRQKRSEERTGSGGGKKIRRRAIIWTLAAIVIAGIAFLAIKAGTGGNPVPPSGSGVLTKDVGPSDQIAGDPSAKVTLVEYSDFQCPACAFYAPVVTQVLDKFKDKMRLVYREFPLPQHQNAELAAQAAEAAGKQGKFWEMHDLLFSKQNEWGESASARSIFAGYAGTLGIALDRFNSDMDSSAVTQKVADDVASGLASGVNATPTFFLNGKQIDSPENLNVFEDLISRSIAQNP